MKEVKINTVGITDLFENIPPAQQNLLWNGCPFSYDDLSFALIHPIDVEGWVLETFDAELEELHFATLLETLTDLAGRSVYIDLQN